MLDLLGAIICPHDILGALYRHSRLLYYVLPEKNRPEKNRPEKKVMKQNCPEQKSSRIVQNRPYLNLCRYYVGNSDKIDF